MKKNISENALIYRIFIDPLLRPIRYEVQSLVGKNRTIIDIACGTGKQAFVLASVCRRIVGVDLSDSMIHTSIKAMNRAHIENIEFYQINANHLERFRDGEFDIASLSMAIHQFPQHIRIPILLEMKRVSKEIILVDFTAPQPKNVNGFIARMLEWLAGKEHFSNFKDYLRNGGLTPLLEQADVEVIIEYKKVHDVFHLMKCKSKSVVYPDSQEIRISSQFSTL